MSSSVRVAWDDSLTRYDFGPGHPMSPARLELTMRLARSFGVLDHPNVSVVAPPQASDELLLTVHEPDYLAAVKRCAETKYGYEPDFGLGTEDNPTFAAMHDATAKVVGGSVSIAEAVWTGEAEHGVNITGGLHHGMPASASGFCVYNDVAVAIQWLLDHGAERIAYVDVDVHHGDGVQKVFWDDPRVMTISLHETPLALFPSTGFPDEIGGSAAQGMAVNVALPSATSDSGWLRAFHAIVPPLVQAFKPEILVTQHGCDTHVNDPLAHLSLSVDGQRASYAVLHALAHEYCGGKWVATGGGGYAVIDVVPRAWTHLMAEMAGHPIDSSTAVPEDWRAHVQVTHGRVAPRTMSDGASVEYDSWDEGYDPDNRLDHAVQATRDAVFSYHGLDAQF